MNATLQLVINRIRAADDDTASQILKDFGRTLLSARERQYHRTVRPCDPRLTGKAKARATTVSNLILDRLRRGPARIEDLASITTRYGARIHDLRNKGWNIKTENSGDYGFIYTLCK